jgi:hypothetical protein
MTRMTIKQIIQELTKSYILGYGVPAEPIELAKGYWELRDDNEIARDTKAGVNFDDYEMWVKTAIADYETNLTLSKFAI